MKVRNEIEARRRGLYACTGALALAASACGAGSAPAVTLAPAAPAAPAATTAPKGIPARGSFEAPDKLLDKCPLQEADSNFGLKQAVAARLECLRRRLDEALVPLKARDPGRFAAMTKEQAEWDRFLGAACDLEEERSWTDFATGERSDGTLRGFARSGCLDAAYCERIFYARAVAADDPQPIPARIEAARQTGLEMRKALDDVKRKAEAFRKTPPALSPAQTAGDWNGIVDKAGEVRSGAAALAQATCDGWPALVTKLGPPAGCVGQLTLYYYAQAGTPEAAY